MKKCNNNNNRSWSEDVLPELVVQILCRCRTSGDRVRLAAVCRLWTAASATSSSSHPPWLLLPRNPFTTKPSLWRWNEPRVLYSLSERKLYPLHPHHQEDDLKKQQRCIGSGAGWMITVDNLTADLQLHHLITIKEDKDGCYRGVSLLPPLSSFPDVHKVLDKHGRLTGYSYGPSVACDSDVSTPFRALKDAHAFYYKAVFFPCRSLVFLICSCRSRLAFASTADSSSSSSSSSWTVCDLHDRSSSLTDNRHYKQYEFHTFSDVALHSGFFYAVTDCCWVMKINLPCATYEPLLLLRPPRVAAGGDVHLVALFTGELMLVCRVVRDWKTSLFHAFKWKGGGGGEWVEVKSLGEWALFVGDSNQSVALSTKDYPELRPNSVYFVYSRIFELVSRDITSIRMGVFCLDGKTMESLPFSLCNDDDGDDGDDDKYDYGEDEDEDLDCQNWPPPVWIPHCPGFPLVSQLLT